MYSVSRKLSQLRIKHLGLLDLIARSGSLRQAAVELRVTQPAVTAMLKELETSFGARLVERDSNGARLTIAGHEACQRLRLVLNMLGAIPVEEGRSEARRHLRVGVLALAMINIVPDAVAVLRKSHPEITFSFLDGTVAEVARGVLDGSLDCAVGRLDSGDDVQQLRELDTVLIGDVPLQAACGTDNPLAEKSELALADLIEEAWVVAPRGSRARESFEQAFIQAGLLPPQPRVELLSFYSSFQFVSRTDMLTISTAAAVAQYARLGLIRPLALEWPIKLPPVMFFCRTEASGLEAIQLFRAAIERGQDHPAD